MFFQVKKENNPKRIVIDHLFGGKTIDDLLSAGIAASVIKEGLIEWGYTEQEADNQFTFTVTGKEMQENTLEKMATDTVVDARDVKHDFLQVLNNISGIKNFDVTLTEDYPKKKWPALTNPSISECTLDGWEGGYQGLTVPPSTEVLTLWRRTARLASKGLPEISSLRKATVYAYPRITVAPLLHHPMIEEMHLEGIKDEVLVVPENSKLSILEIGGMFDAPKKIKINIPPKNSLKRLAISADKIEEVDFLKNLSLISELELRGVETFDCTVFGQCPNIKKISLTSVKKIIHFDELSSHSLESLELFNIKEISGVENCNNIECAEIKFARISDVLLEKLLGCCSAKRSFSVFACKSIDAAQIKNIDTLETLHLDSVTVHRPEILGSAINLSDLRLELYNQKEFDLSFVHELQKLEKVRLPIFEKQKNSIIEYFYSRVRVYLSLSRVINNQPELESEVAEEYCGYDIVKYSEGKKTWYSIREDVSEDLHFYNNNEAEDYIGKILKKRNEKRSIELDSEADSFGASSKNQDNIRWLIDIIEEIKQVRKNKSQ